jgi:hypothetical protein
MSTIRIEVKPLAVDATCTDEALRVVLADSREIAVPLAWFPRLQKATPENGRGGASSAVESGFTGKTWMRIFPSRVFLATKPLLVAAV